MLLQASKLDYGLPPDMSGMTMKLPVGPCESLHTSTDVACCMPPKCCLRLLLHALTTHFFPNLAWPSIGYLLTDQLSCQIKKRHSRLSHLALRPCCLDPFCLLLQRCPLPPSVSLITAQLAASVVWWASMHWEPTTSVTCRHSAQLRCGPMRSRRSAAQAGIMRYAPKLCFSCC